MLYFTKICTPLTIKVVVTYISLHCALASCGAVYCNRSCLWVCDSGRARVVRTFTASARSVCDSLSTFFIAYMFLDYGVYSTQKVK